MIYITLFHPDNPNRDSEMIGVFDEPDKAKHACCKHNNGELPFWYEFTDAEGFSCITSGIESGGYVIVHSELNRAHKAITV